MIEHVYRRASTASRAASVLVATDDERVQDAVLAFGGKVQLTDRRHRNGTERLAEVARGLTCDLIVNVQGDEPLVDPLAIDLAISAFADDPTLCMSTLRTQISDPNDLHNPNVVKVVVDLNDFALYFSRATIPCIDSTSTTNHTRGYFASPSKHIGLYVYRRKFLLHYAELEPTPLERAEHLEQLRALEHGYRIKVLATSHDPISVDTPADLERIRQIMTAGASK
jgi:3-deoxy-manno-octulosonate cytidylyltransferase (CMP-KDO synthetase)